MFISSFQVKNYKSYYDSGQLNLTTGFNIITGQNNVGKSALLEALSLGQYFKDRPHRSLKTVPTANSQYEQTSIIDISLTIYKEELLELLLIPQSQFSIPYPAPNTAFANELGYTEGNTEALVRLKDYLLSQDKLTFNFLLEKMSGNTEKWYLSKFPSFGLYEAQGSEASRSYALFKVTPAKTIKFDTTHNGSNESEFGKNIGSVLRQRIYYFRAERFNAGVSNFGNNSVLESNAQNLAEVLNILQNNRSRFDRFNDKVRQILPQVKLISVRPHPSENQRLEIMVWPHDPKNERADLAVPLNESGTGIGQVLAILYVVLNSDFPRTIIIDEPQSFLHRGAARKLIEILKQHPQHQFIIATHSPTIINAVNPNTITLIKQQDAESSLEVIDSTETKQLRVYLAEVGARLSDVFGADNILWVEGETEELCFPMILERVAEHRLMGTAIIGLKNTGDLEGRHAKIIFEIYNRLSGSESLLPPAIGFILDDEGRPAQQKSDFRKLSKNLAEFIPRRLYENYLLNPSAITAVVNSIEGFRDKPITETEITSWLENKGKDKKYKGPREGKPDEPWIDYVHGAKVLEDLFDDLSEPNVPYDKITHSIALTEWLIENKPEDLKEIADLIVKIINKSQINT